MKLYEITGALRHLDNILAFEDEPPEDIGYHIGLAELALEEKLEGVGKILRNLESDVSAYKEEEERLKLNRKRIENKIKRLKEYVLFCLGGEKVEAGIFKFSEGERDAVEIEDSAQLPDQYCRIKTVREPDKALIKQVLKEPNGYVPGAKLVRNKFLRFS